MAMTKKKSKLFFRIAFWENGEPNNGTSLNQSGGVFMGQSDYWKVFEQTGSIDAYLLYACASEERQLEEEKGDESGKSDRYGSVSSSYWGL